MLTGTQQEVRPLRQDTLESVLTCPHCGFAQAEVMPNDACQFFYTCRQCQAVLRPKTGDCCVFCSYGSVPCPPVQSRQGNSRSCCDD